MELVRVTHEIRENTWTGSLSKGLRVNAFGEFSFLYRRRHGRSVTITLTLGSQGQAQCHERAFTKTSGNRQSLTFPSAKDCKDLLRCVKYFLRSAWRYRKDQQSHGSVEPNPYHVFS